jgi:hypothetical protein
MTVLEQYSSKLSIRNTAWFTMVSRWHGHLVVIYMASNRDYSEVKPRWKGIHNFFAQFTLSVELAAVRICNLQASTDYLHIYYSFRMWDTLKSPQFTSTAHIYNGVWCRLHASYQNRKRTSDSPAYSCCLNCAYLHHIALYFMATTADF